MSEFNFKSAICTSREQSERLLALGLKKETADMHHYKWSEGYLDTQACPPRRNSPRYIPAWSLHRLLSLLPRYVQREYDVYGRKYIAALDLIINNDLCIGYKEGVDEPCYDEIFYAKDIYTSICDAIEWLIEEGYFNKEYLV